MVKTIKIGDRLVGDNCPPYIIAEACINHQGDVNIAKQMTYVAHAMGCDAIKFQMHVLDDEMLRETPQSDNFSEPLFNTLDQTNLEMDEHMQLIELCGQIGIDYLCTPFSKMSADLVAELDVPAIKVGSGELTNIPLQKHIASKGYPMIVSTGMTKQHEITETVDMLKNVGAEFALTHCVSAYPCPYERVNLRNIPRYRDLYNVPVGLSDHSVGIYTSLGAVAHGACIVEKHFTLDKSWPGPDHQSSLEPYELGELVKGCRAVYDANGDVRDIFPEEMEIVSWARESVVTIKPINMGEKMTAGHITVKRPAPGTGAIAAKYLDEVVGKTAQENISENVQVLWSQIGK